MSEPPALRHPAVADVRSWPRQVERWLAVEAALARACGALGIVEGEHAEIVAAHCRLEHLDVDALADAAADAATPIIPLVRMLTEAVPAPARGAVHHGATSQDIIDTAAVLEAREVIATVLGDVIAAGRRCADLAEHERDTLMAGRTLLQHAVPITFGLKAARWLAALTRAVTRLRALTFPVQLGGAAGTLAPFGDRGLAVLESVAADLGLAVPTLPWHAERDALGEIAAACALLAGTCETVATDLLLLTQTEIGEITDRHAGGSSTMPHKRNPLDATFCRAAARLATAAASTVLGTAAHEHERAAGAWQVEWEAFPRTLSATATSVHRLRRALEGLEVDREVMARNLALTADQMAAEPLALALAEHLGRSAASDLVSDLSARATDDGRDLLDVASSDDRVAGVLGREAIDRLRDPRRYLGVTPALIDRALAAWREVDR